uniref:FIP-RBD domain-containing protein n=1 Tax=Macrostomum lignano TaxID=282301 RepID=A0A1I8F531_9PLAT
MFYDEVDYPDPGIYTDAMNDQFKILNERIDQLTQSQSQADTRHNKLMEENQLLRERLKQTRGRLSRGFAKPSRLYPSIESRLRATAPNPNDCAPENARLEERAEALDARLNSAREDAERHRETSRRDLDAVKQERDKAQALLEELNRELDSWRSGGGAGGAGAAGGTRERTASAAEMFNRYREVELLAKRLTQENKNLREQLEEAQAELLTRGLEEGQALLRRHGGTTSLAAELETMTKDELMDLLVREKDGNEKLRNYIDRILLRIMEKQPDLLEVGMLA